MIDDGSTYRGIEAITGWIEQSSKEFEYTSTRIGQVQPDEAHVVVQVRIDGTFPGGTANSATSSNLRASASFTSRSRCDCDRRPSSSRG